MDQSKDQVELFQAFTKEELQARAGQLGSTPSRNDCCDFFLKG